MTKKVKKGCAVIGDGLAANVLIFYLNQYIPELEINQFYSESFFPNASERSTAIVAKRNVSIGLSKLGDLLYHSYEELDRFLDIHKEKFENFFEIIDHLEYGEGEQFEKRFPECINTDIGKEHQEEAFLFYPSGFLDKLRILNRCTREEKLIKSYNQLDKFDFIFDCTSHYMDFLNREVNYKKVVGSYFKATFDFERSFSISYFHKNLIYRKKTKELIIGSSSGSEVLCVNDYLDLKEKFNDLLKIKQDLPEIQDFEFIHSIRQKCSKRLPVWKRVSDQVYLNGGYYKNGYQFAFLAAKELSDSLRRRIG